MESYNQLSGEDRKTFLVRIAIQYIKDHTGYMGMDDEMMYDGTVCDGYCLAEDLKDEFNITDQD